MNVYLPFHLQIMLQHLFSLKKPDDYTKKEVMAIGLIKPKEKSDDWILEDIIIPHQKVTGASCDILEYKEKAHYGITEELVDLGYIKDVLLETGIPVSSMFCWIHLHPGGLSASPSGVDTSQQNKFLLEKDAEGRYSMTHSFMLIFKEDFPYEKDYTCECWFRMENPRLKDPLIHKQKYTLVLEKFNYDSAVLAQAKIEQVEADFKARVFNDKPIVTTYQPGTYYPGYYDAGKYNEHVNKTKNTQALAKPKDTIISLDQLKEQNAKLIVNYGAHAILSHLMYYAKNVNHQKNSPMCIQYFIDDFIKTYPAWEQLDEIDLKTLITDHKKTIGEKNGNLKSSNPTRKDPDYDPRDNPELDYSYHGIYPYHGI